MTTTVSRFVLPALLFAGPLLGAQRPDFETTRLEDGVYQFRFRAHNALIVTSDAGVVVIDPINPEAAGAMVAEIRRVAPGKKLLAVVYSHHHQDHATGANVLRAALGENAPIIAQENAFEPIAAANNPDQPVPTIRFKDKMTLSFGERPRPIELHYLGRSHSDNMIVALLPESRLAFAVDFVSADGVGFRDLPDYYFPDLFTALRRLVELDFDRIAFGHGGPGDRAAVFRQIRYYDDLRQAVERAIDRGLSEEEAASEIRLDDYKEWRGYADWFPLNVRAVYRWLKSAD